MGFTFEGIIYTWVSIYSPPVFLLLQGGGIIELIFCTMTNVTVNIPVYLYRHFIVLRPLSESVQYR